MKVCVPTTSFPRWRGDLAGHFVFDLARHLATEGVEPTVVAPRGLLPDGRPAPRAEEWDGVKIVRFRYWFARTERVAFGGGIPANLRDRPVRTAAQLPLFVWAFGRAIRRVAKGCELVHAHWVPSAATAQWFGPRRPLVVTVHGSDIHSSPRTGLVGRLLNRAIARADAVIAVSPFLAEQVVTRGVPRERVHVVINGIEKKGQIPFFTAKRGICPFFSVLWVGRMVPEKDLATLVAAFRLVHEALPAARLTLVGDGPERSRVEAAVRQAGLAEAVEFAGMQPPERVAEFYSRASVFAFSSAVEGGGLALLEAMAHGLPAVTTPVGFAPAVIQDGVNGRLAPCGDAAALAAGILALLRDPAERERLGQAARRTAEGFTWERTARECRRIFDQVLRVPVE
ncbi:MAG: glycosyltransferase family 4 protein [Planctomycetes bacterium]|nr:glycosyltransferase family 4 protein [Planctomycetota bacterium]